MGTFEMSCEECSKAVSTAGATASVDSRYQREECIVALKVYDQCRQQSCLTDGIIGPARATTCGTICGERINEGEIIYAPCDATNVTVEDFRLKKIVIVGKEPSPFRNGFWDVDLKYVFLYKLVFRETNGEVICCICANSVYNKRVTLFGSIGTDIMIASDLMGSMSDVLDGEPNNNSKHY